MLGSAIDKLKSNWVDVILLIFSSTLFVVFSKIFIANVINHQSILKVFTSFIWIFVALSYIIMCWHKLTTKNKKEDKNDTTRNTIFSQKWFLENFPVIIALTVICIPIIVLFIIAFTSDEVTRTYVVNEPNFETTGDWASLLLGIAFFSQAITEIIKIEQQLAKQILALFQNIGFLCGLFLYLVYASHFKEIG